jgi:hypothetical protein
MTSALYSATASTMASGIEVLKSERKVSDLVLNHLKRKEKLTKLMCHVGHELDCSRDVGGGWGVCRLSGRLYASDESG